MRRFGGGSEGDSTLSSMFFFSRLRRRQVLRRCSAYHKFLPLRPSDTSKRRVARVATPRHPTTRLGPHFFLLFPRARRVMDEENNGIVT
jgi:hypothetical protein